MSHLKGKRRYKAESILIEILQNDKNKLSYVMRALSKYSHILHSIVNNNEELTLRKYLLTIHKDNTMKEVYQSNLNEDEINYLKNAVKARYMNTIRDLGIPLK